MQQVTARIRIDHYPTPTCYLKVWLKKTTTALVAQDCNFATFTTGTPTVDLEFLQYVWSVDEPPEEANLFWVEVKRAEGTKLCLKAPATPPDSVENSVNADQEEDGVYDIEPPAVAEGEGVVVAVEIFKYSYLPGYTPNDPDEEGDQGDKPNGFPLPTHGS